MPQNPEIVKIRPEVFVGMRAYIETEWIISWITVKEIDPTIL